MSGIVDRLIGTTYSVEEQDRIRQLRADFNGSIQTYQQKALEGREKGTLSPEGAQEILARNVAITEWLASNSTAPLLELQAERDKYNSDINNILSVDQPKANYRSFYAGLRFLAELKDPRITSNVKAALVKEAQDLESWYNSNKATLTKIQLEQKMSDAQTRILQTVDDAAYRTVLQNDLNGLKNRPAEEWADASKKQVKNQATIQNADFRIEDVWSSFKETFSWWPILLLVLFCILGGSLAANSAIHRPIPYRVLFFLYGAFPLFVFPVLLYFLIQRVRCGPLPMYGLLPVLCTTPEIEEGNNFFTALLRGPFTYYEDANISRWAGELEECVKQYAQK
jgi:hypothetical protein